MTSIGMSPARPGVSHLEDELAQLSRVEKGIRVSWHGGQDIVAYRVRSILLHPSFSRRNRPLLHGAIPYNQDGWKTKRVLRIDPIGISSRLSLAFLPVGLTRWPFSHPTRKANSGSSHTRSGV